MITVPTEKSEKPPEGKAIKIPLDLYEDLLRLQGVYPGKTLSEIAALKLRKGMEEDRDVLTKLRSMQKSSPSIS